MSFFLVSSLFVLFRFGRRRRTCLFSASKVYSDQYYRLCLVLPFNEEYIGVLSTTSTTFHFAGGTQYYSETALTERRDFVLDRKLRGDPVSTEPCLKSLESPRRQICKKGNFVTVYLLSLLLFIYLWGLDSLDEKPRVREI